MRQVVPEIERLMGDTARQATDGRTCRRHMSFSDGHDWHDILEFDWPSVPVDVEAAGRGDADPLPDKARRPFIDLWPHSHLEMLLAQRPALAAEHGLRPASHDERTILRRCYEAP